jgi:asparagine synthase (glutamine-hydrolysing)
MFVCGITGLWAFDAAEPGPVPLQRMTDALAHRGPDGSGTFHDSDARLRLGHRRLAILDTSDAGAQPMTDPTGRWTIVFNGEIYNFVELRRRLEAAGHAFRTRSDTEVLLAAYVAWGAACQLQLNGMWAFAVWDRAERTLFCSRDRFGVKPFLFHHGTGLFAFASELKAFAVLPLLDLEIDHDYLDLGAQRTASLRSTALRGVHQLLPGHSLRVRADGRIDEQRWWRTVDHLPEVPRDYDAQVEAFRENFADACRIRTRSDVPIATSLSGGLDSSSVAAMVQASGADDDGTGFTEDRQRVFIQSFPGHASDETHWAEMVARHLGTPMVHTTVDVATDAAHIWQAVDAVESPYFLPLGVWAHYRRLREHGVTISIDGHGGDEILAGYPSTVRRQRQRDLSRLRLPAWTRHARISLGMGDTDRRGRAVTGLRPMLFDDARRVWSREVLLRGTLESLAASQLGRTIRGRRSSVDGRTGRLDELLAELHAFERDLEVESRELTPLGRDLYRAFHHDTLPVILRNFDRLAMASGVEIRAPLLDWRVVTFATALPDRAKLGNGVAKRLLRDAAGPLLPAAVRDRTDKVGFRAPTALWLEQGLAEVALDVVARSDLDALVPKASVLRRSVQDAHGQRDWRTLKRLWPSVQRAMMVARLHERRQVPADA